MIVHELVNTPSRIGDAAHTTTNTLSVGVSVGCHAAGVVEIRKITVNYGDVIGLAEINRAGRTGVIRLFADGKIAVLIDTVKPVAIEDDVVSLVTARREVDQVVNNRAARRNASDFRTDDPIVIATRRSNGVSGVRSDDFEGQYFPLWAGIRGTIRH